MIEAKKNATDKERETDKMKLKHIQKRYGYTFAVFLNFKIVKKKKDIEIEFLKKEKS